ncbi:hypothetical protein AMTR_s00124p00094090 [Amborella trichopoda]|uniref:Uncharacterized protein n=1 Tax=Amborella trichopoda TaxID=13333 RepID=W1NR42_AMBTC|nr:hypothetical protein AMTR_s00124p00094090 [Amborella trichopoda]
MRDPQLSSGSRPGLPCLLQLEGKRWLEGSISGLGGSPTRSGPFPFELLLYLASRGALAPFKNGTTSLVVLGAGYEECSGKGKSVSGLGKCLAGSFLTGAGISGCGRRALVGCRGGRAILVGFSRFSSERMPGRRSSSDECTENSSRETAGREGSEVKFEGDSREVKVFRRAVKDFLVQEARESQAVGATEGSQSTRVLSPSHVPYDEGPHVREDVACKSTCAIAGHV